MKRAIGACTPAKGDELSEMMRWLTLMLVASTVCFATPARANDNDIRLLGLGRPESNALSDPAVRRYRALSAELALAMTPKATQPAETLGLSGFEFGFVLGINNIHEEEDYWTGVDGLPIFEGAAAGDSAPGTLVVPTLQIRKGLPMSIDVGVSAAYLVSSRMFMVGAEAKVALHESYLDGVPAIALRVAVNRLLGAQELDIFNTEFDLIVSQAFGVGGVVQLTPYVGFGPMFSQVSSEVIDETPFAVVDSADQRGGANGSLYAFPTLEWSDNRLWRLFAGARMVAASVHVSYTLDLGIMPYDFVERSVVASHSFKIGLDV
ncbi:MAG: hypothetical protein AAFZ38_01905 [Myxococcota bacterium]